MGLDNLEEFLNNVEDAVEVKKDYEEHLSVLCEYLKEASPYPNDWYYNGNGFLQVDVKQDEYDMYLSFIEELVGCSYTHLQTPNGLTLILHINTVYEKMI